MKHLVMQRNTNCKRTEEIEWDTRDGRRTVGWTVCRTCKQVPGIGCCGGIVELVASE
jgi:hypothetical protein